MSTRATLTRERPDRIAPGAPISGRGVGGTAPDAPILGHGAAPDPAGEHVLERLHNLRTILPVFATELASARRQVTQLRVENRKLAEQLRRLQDDALARASASARRRLGSHAPPGSKTGPMGGR
jgi:hypothetical protein